MIPTMEAQVRMAELRIKAREGSLTLDETKEAIAFLRQERMAMPQAKASGTGRKNAPVDTDKLLGELGL